MKIGIIGAGKVGAACAYALVMRGTAREIVLVDRTRGRAKAVAIDMRYGAPLSPTVDIRDGDYQDIAGATLVMITAGINEKSGGAVDRDDPLGRLRLLGTNAEIYKDIVPRIVDAAPEAVLMIITDPPDALADIARGLAQHDRIVSSGTYLDSLRFRVHIAERLGVSPASVDAQILGEHGKSEVFLWSAAHIQGVPVLQALRQRGLTLENLQPVIESDVRNGNIAIIEGNEASQFGIGMVAARVAQMVLRDEREVIPIGSYVAKYGVTLSLPSIVGRHGAIEVMQPAMSEAEAKALEFSAITLRDALHRAGIQKLVA
jgi:L-lactate dehydrogenase